MHCQENLNLPCGKNYRDIKFIGECLMNKHSPILYGGKTDELFTSNTEDGGHNYCSNTQHDQIEIIFR